MQLIVDIEKSFGSFVLKTKFTAEEGVTGILGASGSGKSLTLKCIAGIEKPDRGKIILNGRTLFDSEKKIDLPPQERHVGLLFQNYALFPNMTVLQNLKAGMIRTKKDKETQERLLKEMIRKFRLEGLEQHRPAALSGGQQQRTALARIMLSEPELLMLDEPFSALDGYLKWNLELEMADMLKEFGGVTLMVSHNRDEVYRLCDYVCVMDRGCSAAEKPVKELFAHPDTYAAALLSGCKNYSKVHRNTSGSLIADDWGIVLSKENAPENITCAGVRSHYLIPLGKQEKTDAEYIISCRILKVIDDLFTTVVLLRPLAAGEPENPEQGRLRMELPKDVWEAFCAKENPDGELLVGIQKNDIMLLTDQTAASD